MHLFQENQPFKPENQMNARTDLFHMMFWNNVKVQYNEALEGLMTLQEFNEQKMRIDASILEAIEMIDKLIEPKAIHKKMLNQYITLVKKTIVINRNNYSHVTEEMIDEVEFQKWYDSLKND